MNNETDLDVYLLSLMNSLVIDGELGEDFEELFENINVLLADNPSLYSVINKSTFLSLHLLICLRSDESFYVALNFLTKNSDGLNLPDIFFTKKFVFFITDKLYEKLYDNYHPILDFIDSYIVKYDFVIDLLFDCGFFCLLNGIIETKTCKIYNSIFKGLIKNTKSYKNDCNTNKDCFYEINRKQFDSEIIFNEYNIIKYKNFTFYKQGSKIHDKIYDNLLNSSLYNLIVFNFKEMDHVINYKKNDFNFLIEFNELIEGCFEKKLTFLRIIRKYFYNYKEIEDIGFLKKIYKFLDDKDENIRYECLLIFCLQKEIPITFSEKKIRSIFNILEYNIFECIKCDEEECDGECTLLLILDMLHKLYSTGKKLFFYKISYLILLREISKKSGHIFLAEYFKDILEYFKSKKNNISRVIFPFQTKKGTTIDVTIVNENRPKNLENIECE